jgi:hypothetical protein
MDTGGSPGAAGTPASGGPTRVSGVVPAASQGVPASGGFTWMGGLALVVVALAALGGVTSRRSRPGLH